MKKEIEKKAADELQEFKDGIARLNLKVGDLLLNSYGDLCRIDEIDFKKKIIHTESKHGDEWSSYGSNSIDEFKNRDYIKLEKPFKEYEKDAIKSLSHLEDLELNKEIPETTALVKVGGGERLKQFQLMLESKQEKVEIFKRIIQKKVDALQSIHHELMGQLRKVNKVIGILELYLGVKEEIVQIAEGEQASIDEPVAFRQMILFMDEEVGDPAEGGLDFERIEEFDNWAVDNYEKLVPEKKCVIVMKPRRYSKDRPGLNVFQQAFYDACDKKTYILIRNGTNLYRVFSGLYIDPNFFPSKKEMNKLFDIIEGRAKDKWGHDIEEAREQLLDYKKHLIVMQGLVERTDILHPLPAGFSFASQAMYKKHIRFIYDDAPSLTEGKETYKQWRERINQYIKRGTRILFTGFTYHEGKDSGRFPHYVHSYPESGIYSVQYMTDKSIFRGEGFICYYNPEDEIWGGYWGDNHKRTRSISFRLYCDDEFVLNYDMLDLEAVERFLVDRYDRRSYLHMIPILYGIKKNRLEELEKEKALVKLIASRSKVDEKKVWDAVYWWKTKNIWKRPIMEDDAKALRMIKSKIRR